MKKILLVAFCFNAFFFYGQDVENVPVKTNELRLNAILLIAGAINVTYEKILNDESGLGISAAVFLDDDIAENWYISPYYRIYFGKKPAAGFFLEGFGSLNSIEDYLFDETSTDFNPQNVTDFALGIGLGGKFITKRNLVGEISVGFGRNLFVDNRDYEVFAKGEISVGFRF